MTNIKPLDKLPRAASIYCLILSHQGSSTGIGSLLIGGDYYLDNYILQRCMDQI